jgi:hypothetical protein
MLKVTLFLTNPILVKDSEIRYRLFPYSPWDIFERLAFILCELQIIISCDYFSFTLTTSAGQFNLHSRHAEQLLGFTTMARSSNHSRTLKVQASMRFLQLVHRG